MKQINAVSLARRLGALLFGVSTTELFVRRSLQITGPTEVTPDDWSFRGTSRLFSDQH